MSKLDIKQLAVKDFAINKNQKPQAIFIFTDWEPDDIQNNILLVRLAYELNIPVVMVSGSANNEIQNERAKKYLLHHLANLIPAGKEWLKANIRFLKGTGSKDFPGLGADVLSPEELQKISLLPRDQKPESKLIKEALAQYPQSMVFCIKKPDELMGDNELLSLLAKMTLITYTGGFNYQAPELKAIDKDAAPEVRAPIEAHNASIIKAHQEGIKALFDAFKQVGIVQNYHMLQSANPKDPTPRDIMPAHTPKFVQALKENKSDLGLAIKKSIRVWNEKTILDIQRKVTKFATDRDENHTKGRASLIEIFARKPLELDDKTLDQIKEAVKLLDENDPEIKFRKKMWLNVLDNMEVQCVIADQLTAFVVSNPDSFSNPGVPGTLSFNKEGFIEVKPIADSEEAKCLCFPAIAGVAGKPQDGGTRILAVDEFLCRMIPPRDELQLGSSARLIAGKLPVQPLVTRGAVEARLSVIVNKRAAEEKSALSWDTTIEDGHPCAKLKQFIPLKGKKYFEKALAGLNIGFLEKGKDLELTIRNVDATSFEQPVKSDVEFN